MTSTLNVTSDCNGWIDGWVDKGVLCLNVDWAMDEVVYSIVMIMFEAL